jgi:23S rRNA (adenine2503-C2)-methyltransferase
MKKLTGLRFDELAETVLESGGKKFNAKQIWSWLYAKNVYDLSGMTDIPLKLRNSLSEIFSASIMKIARVSVSSDGTQKLLLSLGDGNFVECVIIPEKERLTLCVSSQAGCKFNCSFCATGKSGFKRDLDASEIVDQVLLASGHFGKRITNVVFMGMGEPFDNFEQTIKAADILSDDSGLAIGKRKITISTFGHTDGIIRYTAEDARYKLAVSLHNPFDDERSLIMPGNKKFGLKGLFEALRKYAKKSNRKVVFEYVLIKGVNDTERHAKELIKLLSTLPSKLNLIKYHSDGKQENISPTGDAGTAKFFNFFKNASFPVVFRTSRGEDIEAACGQLSAKHSDELN